MIKNLKLTDGFHKNEDEVAEFHEYIGDADLSSMTRKKLEAYLEEVSQTAGDYCSWSISDISYIVKAEICKKIPSPYMKQELARVDRWIKRNKDCTDGIKYRDYASLVHKRVREKRWDYANLIRDYILSYVIREQYQYFK